jgi:ribose-phosphate pyrophosphokinase
LAAELLQGAGVQRLVVVDLHAPSIEGAFAIPVSHLSAVSLLVERARGILSDNMVVVAPDLGAAKLADRFARELGVPTAFVHKARVSGTEVEVHGVTGEVAGREPLIVDDMISTAGTVLAAASAVLAAGALPRIAVCASHGLFAGTAVERLLDLGVKHVIVSDSVPIDQRLPIPLEVVGLGRLIAGEIQRLSGVDEKVGATL